MPRVAEALSVRTDSRSTAWRGPHHARLHGQHDGAAGARLVRQGRLAPLSSAWVDGRGGAMGRKWKRGDPVVVVTINRGLPGLPRPAGRKRQNRSESWAGEIVGRSLLGPGWWNVRRLASKGRGHTYAVPSGEIQPRRGG